MMVKDTTATIMAMKNLRLLNSLFLENGKPYGRIQKEAVHGLLQGKAFKGEQQVEKLPHTQAMELFMKTYRYLP